MRKLILPLILIISLILPAYAEEVVYQKFRGVLRAGSILEDLKTGEKTQTKTSLTVWIATKSSTALDCFIYDRYNKPRYQTEIENIKDLEKDLKMYPDNPDISLNIEKVFNRDNNFNIEHHAKLFIETYSGEFFSDYLATTEYDSISANRFEWASYYQTKLKLNPGLSVDFQQGAMQSSQLPENFTWTAFYFGPTIKYYFKPWGSVGLMLQKSLNMNSKSNNNQVQFTSDKIAFSSDIYYGDFSFGLSLERQRMSVEKSENSFALNNDLRQMSIFTFNIGHHFDQLL